MVDSFYHCGFGVRHPALTHCECNSKWGMPYKFQCWAREKYGMMPPVYDSDYTESMRQQYFGIYAVEAIPKKRSDPYLSRLQRDQWTKDLLPTISVDELNSLKAEVLTMYPSAIAKGQVGPKFIKMMVMILLRKKYHCPY